MKKTAYDMLYLCRCGLNETPPDSERLKEINLENLFKMCRFHSLTALVCYALESAGISDKSFLDAKAKAIRKNILLQSEQQKICGFMEQSGIRNMPLKGAVLKDLYPKTGMRQMADNDILYDKNYQQKLAAYMKENGYTAESVGKGNHDVFMKPPVFNFEMHTSLFSLNYESIVYEYYKNVWDKLKKSDGKEYSYRFTDEDFYVYMTAHEHKHYTLSGTGLRSLIDCAVYLRSKPELNFIYIEAELQKLGIGDFEKEERKLALKVFSEYEQVLSGEETKMLEYFLFSGTYGTENNSAENRVNKYFNDSDPKSKLGYVLSRIFPDMNFYKESYPFFYRHKILLPFCWLFRILRLILTKPKKALMELKILRDHMDN